MNAAFFKTPLVFERSKKMHPKLIEIMNEMIDWCLSQGIHPVITCTVSTNDESDELGRVSVAHEEGRAFDLRTRDWTQEMIQAFQEHFTPLYGNLGAISFSSGLPTLIVHHDAGFGPHFHIQMNRAYALKDPLVAVAEQDV